ncbi:MAG: DUF4476 domain-containing protein [Chitinophagaceae bacterium]|nr:MAG: DUF4476 domain-containing protein [Chitinophagaceae bacterium]
MANSPLIFSFVYKLTLMKSSLLIMAFLLAGVVVQAQHNHFIYLQADNKQPFYVKLKGELYSSSAAGYLIIPKLSAGTHELSIGFPKNQWPSQTIPVTIAGKDLGYLLKNFDSKGWGLFNIQTMDVIMASVAPAANNNATTTAATKNDEFSNMLADVVNTASIKEVKAEEKKSAPVVVKEVPPSQASSPTPAMSTTEKAPEIAQPAPVIARSVISKISSSEVDGVANITYLVADASGTDTVAISMPGVIKEETVVASVPTSTVAEPLKAERGSNKPKPSNNAGEPKFIDIDLPGPGSNPTPASIEEVKHAVPAKPDAKAAEPLQMINSDCKTVAGEDDFLKTRKKMTAQKSDDDMVSAAKKLFKQKCYSTAQVKNLSVLFLKDEGKYKFFDAVYPFVYDSREFKQLETQLSEEYYISRFRSMIRK